MNVRMARKTMKMKALSPGFYGLQTPKNEGCGLGSHGIEYIRLRIYIIHIFAGKKYHPKKMMSFPVGINSIAEDIGDYSLKNLHPRNQHDNGKSQFLIRDRSSNGCFFIAWICLRWLQKNQKKVPQMVV